MSTAQYFTKAILLMLLLLSARPLSAQTAPEGIWQGYDGEWKHVSKQLIDLAEVTPEADVINWLQRSLTAVKEAHAFITPKDLGRKVHIADRDATVDGMYLRLVVHANEHMGQLIAYARMSGVTPPWSKQE